MIEIHGISKSYKTGSFVQKALDNVSITFRDSEFVAVLGTSGSGKTTLLNILGGLDRADEGDIVINGVSTQDYHSSDWDTYRNHRIGFIFQSYNLIPHQSVVSNVELALTLAGVSRSERRERALAALARVGLAEHAQKKPNQLSGGQMQRVAIARAIINDPDIVLADEPTGALDTDTGIQVMDILSEISQDRLVIMVTHNPDLAKKYADRIVRLSDGRIIDDSDPAEAYQANTRANKRSEFSKKGSRSSKKEAGLNKKEAKPSKKASMSFATALSLSFNNLMSKKGRTAMTAIAGSIGIMGIAAILALSNGVNEYIARTEEETLSSYPLTINKSNYDLTALITGGSASEAEEGSSSDQIPTTNLLSSIFSHIQNNDLASLKEYFDSGNSGIEQYVNAIQYGYDVSPQIFKSDTSDGVVQLSPGTLSSLTASSASSSSVYSSMSISMDSFSVMLDEVSLLSEQYDVVAGNWPQNYDECVLVLSSDGSVSDYTLYSLGILDTSELESMVMSMLSSEEIEVSEADVDFTYEDALSLTFKVVNGCDMYQYNSETETWTDMSVDTEFMTAAIEDALELKVVGVVQPSETSSVGALSEGIAYPSSLILHLMQEAGESEIVQQQLANPEVDVLTGRTFDELNSDEAEAFDMSSMFIVDEEALQEAFGFDTSYLGTIQIDASAISDSIDSEALANMLSNMPTPDLSSLTGDSSSDSSLSEEQQAQINQISQQIVDGFLPFWYERHSGESITEQTDMSEDFSAYLTSDQVQMQMAQIVAIQGSATAELVSQAMSDYMTNTFEPYLNQVMYSMMSQMATSIESALSEQMSALSSLMGSAFSFDTEAFVNAISFNMTEEDLYSIMNGLYSSDVSSLDNNLSTLGYADEEDPSSISIYSIDFESKDAVMAIIDDYNDSMESLGEEDKVVVYSDLIGSLMSTVTNIVNMIGYVLIAFVSISLVVSSIMIGIITYISVLERRKEIGILRAMGASKGNIANVFNAETIIEGLFAGVFAIAIVLLISIPVNAFVLSVFSVSNIMSLPALAAAVLILISVALTFIAGLIPSSAASRRDPVEALRSE